MLLHILLTSVLLVFADEEEFAVRNRELVEQDKGLKEFICKLNHISLDREAGLTLLPLQSYEI